MTAIAALRFTPSAWFWKADDGRIYSSAAAAFVQAEDAGYSAFTDAGGVATVWPRDATGTQTDASLAETLVFYGLQAGPPTLAQLIAYAEAKQAPVLAALQVTHALKDGAATLTTMCDDKSRVFLNSLAAWVLMNASANPAPTRTYYNLDGSAVQVTPADMGEFLTAIGAAEQSTFDAVAEVRTAITSSPPTITTLAQVDGFAWPTTAN